MKTVILNDAGIAYKTTSKDDFFNNLVEIALVRQEIESFFDDDDLWLVAEIIANHEELWDILVEGSYNIEDLYDIIYEADLVDNALSSDVEYAIFGDRLTEI